MSERLPQHQNASEGAEQLDVRDSTTPNVKPPATSAAGARRDIVLPQDFYATFTSRDDIRAILKQLAER
jgi:hypothetical protein